MYIYIYIQFIRLIFNFCVYVYMYIYIYIYVCYLFIGIQYALQPMGAPARSRAALASKGLLGDMFILSGGRLCTLVGVPWRGVSFSTLSTGRFVLKQYICKGAESAEHAETAGYTYEGTPTTAWYYNVMHYLMLYHSIFIMSYYVIVY